MHEFRRRPAGFTLVELLVVIAIIALLITILLPSLGRARAQARLVVCGSNMRQMGVSIHLYAEDFGGLIPQGPPALHPFDFEGKDVATNQLWAGNGSTDDGPVTHPWTYIGLGTLKYHLNPEPSLFWCPSDNSASMATELPQFETEHNVFGSYYYRQVDYLPAGHEAGNIDNLGYHEVPDGDGTARIRVEALAVDANSFGKDPTFYRTNHKGKEVNVVYVDGSVAKFLVEDDRTLGLPAEAFPPGFSIKTHIDQLLSNADYSYITHPRDAPTLPGL